MRIVLDANILIAGLLSSRGTIAILASQNHLFCAPEKIVNEIRKHKKEICNLGNQTSEEFEMNYNALLKFIKIVRVERYKEFLDKAREAIGKRDIGDIDYVACALAIKADFIWSNDEDSQEVQQIIPVKTTEDFIEEGR